MSDIVPQNATSAQSNTLKNVMKYPRVSIPLQELRKRYMNGESENALANHYGVGRPTIHTRLIKMGVPLRSQTEANQAMMKERTPEENKRNTNAANKVSRGRVISFDELCRVAKGKQKTQAGASPNEKRLQQWLQDNGVVTTPQLAIGPYNVDLAFQNTAIEIYGGLWHASGIHFSYAKDRFEYIRGQGWNVIILWITRDCPMKDTVINFIQSSLSDFQNTTGQCKVAKGNGTEFHPDTMYYKRAIGLQ